MTAITPVALGPLATLLPMLDQAGRSRHVVYTLAPAGGAGNSTCGGSAAAEIRPPRITIELASSAEVERFAAAILHLTEAVPAQNVSHLAIVLDELIGRAVARWSAPRAVDDPWYHSRATAHALAAAAEQPHASPLRRSALAQAAACALVAMADWDRRNDPSKAAPPTMDDIIGEMVAEGGTLAQAACTDGLRPEVLRGPVMTCDTCLHPSTCLRQASGPANGCWEARHV